MLQSIFCLLAMSNMDGYQFELSDQFNLNNYSQYLVVYAKVDQQRFRYVRFYRWYYQQLPIVYFIIQGWTIQERYLWVVAHPEEYQLFRQVIDQFIFQTRKYNYATTFEVYEYQKLKQTAEDIARLITTSII